MYQLHDRYATLELIKSMVKSGHYFQKNNSWKKSFFLKMSFGIIECHAKIQ